MSTPRGPKLGWQQWTKTRGKQEKVKDRREKWPLPRAVHRRAMLGFRTWPPTVARGKLPPVWGSEVLH